VQNGGASVGVYSVLAPSGVNHVAHTDPGGSTSGTAFVAGANVSATGHIGTLTFNWSGPLPGGDLSTGITGPTLSNPTFSRLITGVANGTTSGTYSSFWRCTITDSQTGATATFDVQVDLAWTNTIPAYSPHTDVRTSGSGITIPPGAPSVTITVVGGGGGGGGGAFDIPTGDDFGGNGGGSGGWRSQTYSISPSDYNATINYSIGVGAGQYPAIGGTSSFNGSVTGAGLSATGGTGGLAGKQPLSPGSVGGSPNGVNGTAGGDNFGGSGGNNGKGAGRGGDGSTSGSTSGDSGAVIFQWN